jgi:hypothetical protein
MTTTTADAFEAVIAGWDEAIACQSVHGCSRQATWPAIPHKPCGGTKPTGSGSATLLRDARTGIASARIKSSSDTSPAVDMAAVGTQAQPWCPESGYLIPILGKRAVARFVPISRAVLGWPAAVAYGCRSVPDSARRGCPCVGGAFRVVCCRVRRSLARSVWGVRSVSGGRRSPENERLAAFNRRPPHCR